jgi:hypothetical protein
MLVLVVFLVKASFKLHPSPSTGKCGWYEGIRGSRWIISGRNTLVFLEVNKAPQSLVDPGVNHGFEPHYGFEVLRRVSPAKEVSRGRTGFEGFDQGKGKVLCNVRERIRVAILICWIREFAFPNGLGYNLCGLYRLLQKHLVQHIGEYARSSCVLLQEGAHSCPRLFARSDQVGHKRVPVSRSDVHLMKPVFLPAQMRYIENSFIWPIQQ